MVTSVSPVIHSSTASLNKVGFSASEEKEAAQPQVSLETPKDTFKKKESHAVGIGASIGAGIQLGYIGIAIYKAGGFSKFLEKAQIVFNKEAPEWSKHAKSYTGAILVGSLALTTGIGAGVGAIVKHFSKD